MCVTEKHLGKLHQSCASLFKICDVTAWCGKVFGQRYLLHATLNRQTWFCFRDPATCLVLANLLVPRIGPVRTPKGVEDGAEVAPVGGGLAHVDGGLVGGADGAKVDAIAAAASSSAAHPITTSIIASGMATGIPLPAADRCSRC